jgi:hypothetical protein
MKNKMELLQAAQAHAAAEIAVADSFNVLKAKMESFELLNISHEHWQDFSGQVDAARAAYQQALTILVKPATPPVAS